MNGNCRYRGNCRYSHEPPSKQNQTRKETTLYTERLEKAIEREEMVPTTQAKSFAVHRKTDEDSKQGKIALRTVEVWLANNERKIKACMLLDDASTECFIRRSVADQLKLRGVEENVEVTVVGGKHSKLNMERVKLNLKSKNGRINIPFEALILQNPTGKMIATNWEIEKERWPHLRDIKFSALKSQKSVDGIIGANYIQLHKSIKEVTGKIGDPVARLTPLGWTCVGIIKNEKRKARINFVRAFWTRTDEVQEDCRKSKELKTLRNVNNFNNVKMKEVQKLSKPSKDNHEKQERETTKKKCYEICKRTRKKNEKLQIRPASLAKQIISVSPKSKDTHAKSVTKAVAKQNIPNQLDDKSKLDKLNGDSRESSKNMMIITEKKIKNVNLYSVECHQLILSNIENKEYESTDEKVDSTLNCELPKQTAQKNSCQSSKVKFLLYRVQRN